jgi:hypothetical protein
MHDQAQEPRASGAARCARALRRFAPVLVPLALGLVLLAGAVPFVRVLSMDFRVLLESLKGIAAEPTDSGREHAVPIPYELDGRNARRPGITFEYEEFDNVVFTPPVVGDGWATAGALALYGGALPLLALLLVELGLRCRARRAPGARTLRDLASSRRALLATAALLPFAAFAVPLALALCVWLVVEVFPWLEWFDHSSQLTETLLIWGFAPLLAGVLLTGAWLARTALRRRPAPAAPASPSARRRRFAWRLALALPLSLPPLAVAGLGLAPHAVRLVPALGTEAALARHCAGCHSPLAPLHFVRSPDDWRRSLAATCFPRAAVPADEREEILSFVVAARSFSDATAFRTRCQRCHGLGTWGWADRHPEDWAGIVGRVGRYSPFYYDPGVQTQIVRHLAATRAAPADGAEGAQRRLAVRACTACHFFSRGVRTLPPAVSEADAVALVRRMSARMAQPLTEPEIQAVAAVWRATVHDPAALRALVPHDRPQLEEERRHP